MGKSNVNRLLFLMKQKMLFDLVLTFEKNNVSYISFKGVVLSYWLYDIVTDRVIRDIDIYVESGDFSRALNLLSYMEYQVMRDNELNNPHHVVLSNGKCVVELHRNMFNPVLNINEEYLKKHLIKKNISGQGIITFDITATLIYLIYHLYMDTCLTGITYGLCAVRDKPRPSRFIYRAYEIALFVEKYFYQIVWEDVINDLKKQNFRISFRIMYDDIMDIFPNIFPDNIKDVVNNLIYVEPNYDAQDNKSFFGVKPIGNKTDFKKILINFIHQNWNPPDDVLLKPSGYHIVRKKHCNIHCGENNDILSYKLTISEVPKGVNLSFEIDNDDCYVLQCDHYGSLKSSNGIYLLLCSIQKYVYMSIFLAPKFENGIFKVIAYDLLNDSIVDSTLIGGEIRKQKEYYKMNVILCKKFLYENQINQYFYLGLAISDCNSQIPKGKNIVILSEPENKWYNPIYFVKIELNGFESDVAI